MNQPVSVIWLTLPTAPSLPSTMSSATEFLQSSLGVAPLTSPPDPSIPRGILDTHDYKTFELMDPCGETILKSWQGAKQANRCLPGDHVMWDEKTEQCVLELRDHHPLLVGTLELANKTRYGMTRRKLPMVLFTPYDTRYPPFIVGTSEKDLSQNRVAVIQFDEWVEGATFPRGHLQSILGPSGDYEAERNARIQQACPWTYREKDLQGFEPVFHSSGLGPRTLLEGYTFHIDPPGCKDVDDVFTFSRKEETGQWVLTITISDVDGYVEDGSPLDLMASMIGQTLYDDAGNVLRPMLPSLLSEGLCSLVPGKRSYGVSLQADVVTETGELQHPRWLLTELHVNASYTYDEFQDAATDTIYRPLVQQIATFLAGGTAQTDAHEWVAQLMIYYNRMAGERLKTAGQGGILRRHSPPKQEMLEAFARLTEEHTGIKEDLRALAFSAAEYCSAEDKETTHYGLQAAAYAHASSPIRRYADLVNQRILKHLIQGQSTHWIVPVSMRDLNRRDKAVRRFARDMLFIEHALRMPRHAEDPLTLKGYVVGQHLVAGSEPPQVKIQIYVPCWKRSIAASYRLVQPGHLDEIWSRDESRTMSVQRFQEVTVQVTFDLRGRNWKERAIFSIL